MRLRVFIPMNRESKLLPSTAVVFFFFSLIMTGQRVGGQILQTQSIRLGSSWNLIAFQVIPTNSSPASVFGILGSDFVAAGTFDNRTKQWSEDAASASLQVTNHW